MRFSIIIPVRQINAFLKESISHLQQLNYENYEVLIITDKPAYDFGDKNDKFFIIPSGIPFPSNKRNLGAEKATGDILVFLDDDAYPAPDWLNKAASIFTTSDTYALGAPAVTPPNASFLERMSGRILESSIASGGVTYRHIPKKPRLVNDYPTVNLFVRKEAFDAIGGFDTNYWPGEDTKLCLDLVKHFGKSFLYDPAPIVYHHRRNVFFPHLKQVSRYGLYRGRFARIFPETSRLPSYAVPSLFVLGLVFVPLLIIFLGIVYPIYLSVLWFYVFLLAVESLRISIKEKRAVAFLYAFTGFFLTHLVYGINFINGFFKPPKLESRGVDSKSGNYLGG